MLKIFWLIIGITSSGIGMLGIVVPGLPTTIFMIIAAACFIKSNQRLYEWVINHKYFGSNVKNYLDGKGMPRKAKSKAIILMWIFVSISIFFGIPEYMFAVRVFTFLGACVGTVIITAIPTYQT